MFVDDVNQLSEPVRNGVLHPDEMRLFCGQVCWAPGQLAHELAMDTWVLLRADREVMESVWKLGEAVENDPWKSLMTRLGGDYAALATLPPNAGDQLHFPDQY